MQGLNLNWFTDSICTTHVTGSVVHVLDNLRMRHEQTMRELTATVTTILHQRPPLVVERSPIIIKRCRRKGHRVLEQLCEIFLETR